MICVWSSGRSCMVYLVPSWDWLTQVVLEKMQLNGCSSSTTNELWQTADDKSVSKCISRSLNTFKK